MVLNVLKDGEDGRRFLTGRHGEVSVSAPPVPADTPTFLVTKEHRRFEEFANTVRNNRHIGVCYGPPGVGKTLSARTYAGASEWEQWQRFDEADLGPIPPRVLEARTAIWTPSVTVSPRQIDQLLPSICQSISWAVEYHQEGNINPFAHRNSRMSGLTELLIIDEADRLKPPALEQVRDYYDKHTMGVILIGMPGIEKRLARYPQLYSRIGFAHELRRLSPEELAFVLKHRWADLGLTIDPGDFTDAEAIAAVSRITNGNFRLVQRLFSQIGRIREINQITTVTKEVVEAAREALLIGT